MRGRLLDSSIVIATSETLAFQEKATWRAFRLLGARAGTATVRRQRWCNCKGGAQRRRASDEQAPRAAAHFSGSSFGRSDGTRRPRAEVVAQFALFAQRSTDPCSSRLHARCSVSCRLTVAHQQCRVCCRATRETLVENG